MSIPTRDEEFTKLVEYLRKAEEAAAMMGHLVNADAITDKEKLVARGWLGISELLRRMVTQVTRLAVGKLQ